jgi:hypothetical protein
MGGIIQFTQLGRFGRFGNQLFQYAFAKAYAQSVGAVLQTPPWVGQVLFEDINDPPCSANLRTLGLDEIPPPLTTDVNLFGYFQFAGAFKHYGLSDVRRWFRFKSEWRDRFTERHDLVAHLRRGDYLTKYASTFCTVGDLAYKNAMERLGYLPQNAVWVREDYPTQFPHPGLEWLQDFFTLMNARVLFRANSTFSWWAATLGEARVYSPVVEGKVGFNSFDVEFVPGNRPRCASLPNTSDFILADMYA